MTANSARRCKKSSLQLFPVLALLTLVCGNAIAPRAQTNTFIAGSGNWSPPQAWSLQQLPNRSENCAVPAGSSPIGDLGVECLNFSMGTGATLLITPGYLFPYGSLVNQGAITVGSGDGLSFQQNSGTATISGGGTITLANGNITTGAGLPTTLVNVDHVISGQGHILLYQFTNQATINANSSGNTLSVQTSTAGFTNTGTLEASNGGTLLLVAGSPVTLNNAGATIQALNGSTVQFEGYILSGGTITTSGSGVFQNINSSYYSNITNNGAFQTIGGNYAIFEGTIINNGTFSAPNGGYQINGNVTLKGTGTVTGGNAALFHSSFAGGGTLTLQQPLSGGGSIGDNSFTFTNQSTVNANNPSTMLTLAGNPETNTATLEASSGGTLEIQNTVNNTGGTITANNGSTVLLDFSGTVNGGTLTTSGSGSFQTTSGTLDGSTNVVTNAGLFNVGSGDDLNLKGTISNSGTFALASAGCLAMSAPTTLTGSGTVQMTGISCLFGRASNYNLTNQSTIEGAGTIGDSNPMGFTNSGTVIANQASPMTIVSAGSGFSNPGSLIVKAGSTLNVNGQMNNLSQGILTGGTLSVAGTMVLENAQYTTITTNSANITLTSAAAQILNGLGGPSALANFATNNTKGVLSLQGGQILSTSANFTNKGTLTVGAGSGFGAGGTYTQTGGTTTVDGLISAPAGFSLKKGKLFGAGTISGAVAAAAAVNAGDSATIPGILSVSNYSQSSTGSLTIPIASNVVGTGYGQLASANGVILAGKLLLKRVHGYVPPIGSAFTILTGSTVSGQFASPLLTINSREHFQISYNPTSVTLTVVAGP
jgi:hypothetical protein